MSTKKPWVGSQTQRGHAPPKTRDRAFDDTLPATKASTVSRSLSLEPSDLVTSARASSVPATAQTSGAVTLSGARVAEPLAREIIARRMSQKGIDLVADYAYSYNDLLVTLDGFDPVKNVGYQYISHAGADVVTDFDHQVEERVRELGAQGILQLLVIHDHDAPDSDAVLERVDAFLASL